MAMGGRGTQKSLSGGTIETLMLIHDDVRDWFHCAAIMDQSERTYQYVLRFFSNPWMSPAVQGDPLMKKTTSVHGTYLQIGTGTIKSVSGFHGSVVMDEYDLMDKIVTKMAKGMLSAQQGRRPFMIYLSSRYFATGNVNDMDKKQASGDFRMHKWGILEMTERCPASWSGKKTKKIGWVNDENLVAIDDREYGALEESKKSDYSPHTLYENCLKCGIFSFCKGNLKKQVTREENPYLEPLEETLAKFRDNDTETFKSQRLNRKSSSKDLMYPQLNDSVHVLSVDEMYELYSGEKCTVEEPTVEWLISVFAQSPDCMFYYSADPGFDTAAATLNIVDGLDRVFVVDELTEHGMSEGEFALLIWQRWGHLPLRDGFPDQIPTFMKDLKRIVENTDPRQNKGPLPVNTKVDKSAGSVKLGASTIRKLLRIPGTMNKTRLYFLDKCVQFRYQMENYRRKVDPRTGDVTDEPIKGKGVDHHPDHFRYFIHTMFGKDVGKLSYASVEGDKPKNMKHEIDDIDVSRSVYRPENALRAPTAGELAASIGVIGFHDNSGKKPKPEGQGKRKAKLSFSI